MCTQGIGNCIQLAICAVIADIAADAYANKILHLKWAPQTSICLLAIGTIADCLADTEKSSNKVVS